MDDERYEYYYYGDGVENVVQLTEAQASAVNQLAVSRTIRNPETGETILEVTLTPEQMYHYESAAHILNEYLETNTVTHHDQDIPLLRAVSGEPPRRFTGQIANGGSRDSWFRRKDVDSLILLAIEVTLLGFFGFKFYLHRK